MKRKIGLHIFLSQKTRNVQFVWLNGKNCISDIHFAIFRRLTRYEFKENEGRIKISFLIVNDVRRLLDILPIKELKSYYSLERREMSFYRDSLDTISNNSYFKYVHFRQLRLYLLMTILIHSEKCNDYKLIYFALHILNCECQMHIVSHCMAIFWFRLSITCNHYSHRKHLD